MTTGKTLGQIGEDAYQRWLDTGAIGQSIDAIAAAVEAAVLQRVVPAALLDAERYRTVTYGKRHKYIWNHVLTDVERDSGHDLNAVLDAMKGAQS